MSAMLYTPAELCQNHAEFDRLLTLYRQAKPARVLEIGTGAGGSLYHWLKNAADGALVVTVDLPEPDYPLDREMCGTWARDTVDLIMVAGDSHDPDTIELVAEHGPYEWLFIDGNHRYQDARADFDAYRPMVEPGGHVILHDIALVRDYDDGTEAGVSQLWEEVKVSGRSYEIRHHMAQDVYGIGVLPV